MGQIKQLLPLGDRPVIRHCLDCIIASGIKNIVVVLGKNNELMHAINDLPIKIIVNPDPESEMAESVKISLKAIDKSSTGVLICLSDYPLISVNTLKTLTNLHSEYPDKIIIPVYKEKRGHPTLFPISMAKEVSTGLNLRGIINRNADRIKFSDVSDEGVILDMDTVEDYGKILERARGGRQISDEES